MPAKKTATSKSTASNRKHTATKTRLAAKKGTSPKTRTASSRGDAKSKAGEQEVTIDRRRKADRREETIQESIAPKTQPQLARRAKVQRRRQIDPTTCERDYSDAEVEFMNAMDEYKRTSGRMFPTCSEVLEVIRELGYVQLTPAEMATVRPEPTEKRDAIEGGQEEFKDVDLKADEVAC